MTTTTVILDVAGTGKIAKCGDLIIRRILIQICLWCSLQRCNHSRKHGPDEMQGFSLVDHPKQMLDTAQRNLPHSVCPL
jgi:hypothetical protein